MEKEVLKNRWKEGSSRLSEAYPRAKKSREDNVELQFIVPWAMSHDKREEQKLKPSIKSSESIAFF